MTIRYSIKLSTETTASKASQGYDSLEGVTIVLASFDEIIVDIDDEDQVWFETVLDADENVLSYRV